MKSEASNLKEELKKAQAALKAVPPPVDTTAFQQQADMLRSVSSNCKVTFDKGTFVAQM